MTATANDQTGCKKRPEPSAEARAAAELVRAAKEQGLSLTGPDAKIPAQRDGDRSKREANSRFMGK